MKRLICLILPLVAFFMNVQATAISEDSARTIAAQVLSHHYASEAGGRKPVKGLAPQLRRLAIPNAQSDDAVPPYYVFTRANGSGFALIAADDAVGPLLGYSLDGTFSTDSLPCALKEILSILPTALSEASGSGRHKLGGVEPGKIIAGPYIKTRWNQGNPYNLLTPTYTSNGNTYHYVTGCVPTAAAQVMNYYRYPAASYYRPYDWAHMNDTYQSYTSTEGMAVATLMRDLGVIMGSSYGTSGTGTYVSGYARIPGYKYTWLESLDEVKEYVTRGPILISIDMTDGLGHAVIVDGMEENGFYHVNWGWGGSNDGYYDLEDMGIMYGNSEIHPYIKKSYSMFLEPDEANEPVSLIATGGVTVDRAQATAGQEVTVTLHSLKQVSGSPFNGYLGLHIVNGKNSYDDYYTDTRGSNGKTGFARNGSFPTCRVPWNANRAGEDVTITFTMEEMSREGTWYIVPISCDQSEGSGENKSEYHQLALYTDDFIDNNVTFNWSNNIATFKEATREDYDLSVKSIVPSTTYRRDGTSQLIAQVANDGTTTFNGTITLTLAATDGKNSDKIITADLSIPAGGERYCHLTTTFNFTGEYRVTGYELSRVSQSGSTVSITSGTIASRPFEILPAVEDVDGTDLYSYYYVIRYYSNIYACETNNYTLNAYAYVYNGHVDFDHVDMDFVAVPQEGGTALPIAHYDNIPIQQRDYITSTSIPFERHDMETGSYVLAGFVHYGNRTMLMIDEDYFNECVSANSDNHTCLIINVLDPGVEIPKLKMHGYKTLGPCYLDQYNTVAVEVENTGDNDYYGYFGCTYNSLAQYMYRSSPKFCVKAGEKGTVFVKFKKYIDEENTSTHGEINLTYMVNNGERDLSIPFEGNNLIAIDFEEQPTDSKFTYNSSTLFYYKNSPQVHSTLWLSSPATVKRTIYDGEKEVLKLPELTLSRYGYIQPETDDLKNLPVGTNYRMVAEFIEPGATKVSSTVVYAMQIFEDVAITVNDVNFVQSGDLSVNDELPFFIKATNLTDAPTALSGYYYLYKVEKDNDGYTTWYTVQSEKRFNYSFPAQTKKAFHFTAVIEDEDRRTDGEFALSTYCNRHNYTGMCDYISSTKRITLPFKSSGISEPEVDNDLHIVKYYDLQGRELAQPAPGVNIVKMSDGSTRKILIQQ